MGKREAYRRFWNEFSPEFSKRYPDWTGKPRDPNWMEFDSSKPSVFYSASFCSSTDRGPADRLRAEVFMKSSKKEKNKEVFDDLYRRKDQIEEKVGDGLDWDRKDDTKKSRISLYFGDEIRVTEEER